MDILELIYTIRNELKSFQEKVTPDYIFCYCDSIKVYPFQFQDKPYNLKFSLFDLSIFNPDEFSEDLLSKLRIDISDSKIIRGDKYNQRRVFLTFLKLQYPKTWIKTKFCERVRD